MSCETPVSVWRRGQSLRDAFPMVVQVYYVLDDDDENLPLAKLTEFERSARSGATGGTPCQLRQGRDRRPQARSSAALRHGCHAVPAHTLALTPLTWFVGTRRS